MSLLRDLFPPMSHGERLFTVAVLALGAIVLGCAFYSVFLICARLDVALR